MTSPYLDQPCLSLDERAAEILRGVADMVAHRRPLLAIRLRLMANGLSGRPEPPPSPPCDTEPQEVA